MVLLYDSIPWIGESCALPLRNAARGDARTSTPFLARFPVPSSAIRYQSFEISCYSISAPDERVHRCAFFVRCHELPHTHALAWTRPRPLPSVLRVLS